LVWLDAFASSSTYRNAMPSVLIVELVRNSGLHRSRFLHQLDSRECCPVVHEMKEKRLTSYCP
jgi:hypothetical protein